MTTFLGFLPILSVKTLNYEDFDLRERIIKREIHVQITNWKIHTWFEKEQW
jgi:hypothetical protein